jgi:hypothetical protein
VQILLFALVVRYGWDTYAKDGAHVWQRSRKAGASSTRRTTLSLDCRAICGGCGVGGSRLSTPCGASRCDASSSMCRQRRLPGRATLPLRAHHPRRSHSACRTYSHHGLRPARLWPRRPPSSSGRCLATVRLPRAPRARHGQLIMSQSPTRPLLHGFMTRSTRTSNPSRTTGLRRLSCRPSARQRLPVEQRARYRCHRGRTCF